jgi:hypothetical protein
MKNQILRIIPTLSFLALLARVALYAQSSGIMIANIPFNFSVGKTALPAGEYIVRPISPVALLIQSEKSAARVIVMTMPVQAKKSLAVGKLVFNRYGDQYFLSKVWPSDNRTGRELSSSRLERELAKAVPEHLTVSITALSEAVHVELQF